MSSVHVSRLLSILVLSASLLAACGGENSATLVREAKAKAAAGDYKAAIIQLKNAVAADEKNAEARFELGKLYLDQLDLPSAEKEFRRAREAGYPSNQVNPMIARALLGLREYQRVLDELPPAGGEGNEAATLEALRATAYMGLGNKDDARAILQKIAPTAPENPEIQLALARLALLDGHPDQALQAIDQALQLAPDNTDAHLLKGDLMRALGKLDESAQAYQTALKQNPRYTPARLALADIAITQNRLDDARKEVDTALKNTPNSLQARYTQAMIDFREKKIEPARDHLAPVLKSAPEFVPALLLGGAIEYSLNHLQTAETYLGKVAKAMPDNLYAIRLLAATQLRLGRPDDAAGTLAPALKSSPDAGILVVAGEIAQARRNFAEAAAYFEQAAQRSPDSAAIRTELGIARLAQGDNRAIAELQAASGMAGSGSRPDTFLIVGQLERKQFDAALASIAALEKKLGASAVIWNYRGAAYLGKNDAAKARDSFVQSLKLDPAFFAAAANLAQLDLQSNQPGVARQRFESVLKADPKNLNAMLALADMGLRNKDESAYVSWLEKAAATHPEALQPRVALTRYLLAKGNRNKALNVASEAANAQPDNPAAIDLLGTVQLALGDTVNALGSYRKLVDRQPGQAAPLVKLATAQIVAKDIDSARKSLQSALRVQPDYLAAQQMLGGVEIQSGRYDDALALARQIQKQQPTKAVGYVLEGDAAYARKNYPGALSAFEQAFRLEPSGTLLIRELQVFNALQKPAEGESRLVAWLSDHPKDASPRAALAENLLKRKQFKAAVEQYSILNTNAPNNLLVLNNLAWALSEMGDSRALGFAEQALKLKPDNPAVIDTLGWILVQRKQTERGIKLIQQALEKSPDAPDIQFHLAAALAQSGDTRRAKGELERLLASGIAFPQEDEARALLSKLQKQ